MLLRLALLVSSVLSSVLVVGAGCDRDNGRGGGDGGFVAPEGGIRDDDAGTYCGGPCPVCPAGTMCVPGAFLPECLPTCNDNRDCPNQLVCQDFSPAGRGTGFCVNQIQDLNHPAHPTPCTPVFCSPPWVSECLGDGGVLHEVAGGPYCGHDFLYCPLGCHDAPTVMSGRSSAYCNH